MLASFFMIAWRSYLHGNKPCACDLLSIWMLHSHAFDFMFLKCCYAKMISVHNSYLTWIGLPSAPWWPTYQEQEHWNKSQNWFYLDLTPLQRQERKLESNFQNLSLSFLLCYNSGKYTALRFKEDKLALYSETCACYWQYPADILAPFCSTCLSL